MKNTQIITRELKKGTPLTEISRISGSTFEQVRYIYMHYPQSVTNDTDHIIYLGLRYPIYRKLIRDNMISIKTMFNLIDSNSIEFLSRYDDNVQNEIFDRLCSFNNSGQIKTNTHKETSKQQNSKKEIKKVEKQQPVKEIEERVLAVEELAYEFLTYIHNIFNNPKIRKIEIEDSPANSTNSEDKINIFLGELYILINANWLKNHFDQHCTVLKYGVTGYTTIHSYFKIAMDFISKTTSIFYQKIVDNRKYSYNRYPSLTGTNDSYLKLFIDKFEQFTNRFVKIAQPEEHGQKLSTNVSVATIIENNTAFNQTNAFSINPINVYNTIITECKDTFGIRNAFWITVEHTKVGEFKFESKTIKGVYSFKPDGIDCGILSCLPLEAKVLNEKELKRQIISLLKHMNK